MSDPTADPERRAAGPEVEIDLAAFLPEGTVLAGAEAADVTADETETDADAEVGPEATEEPAGEGPRPAPVDLEALTQIEADLAAVDAALLAIDRGDLDGSPLLVELLAGPTPEVVPAEHR